MCSATSCDDGSGAAGDAAARADAAQPEREPGAASDGEIADEDAGALDAGPALQEVSIQFKAKLGERELACGEHYSGQGTTGVAATPQDFRFYVQEVRLVRADGSEERVAFDEKPPFQSEHVALIDFTDGTGGCGSGGSIANTTITGKLPAGDYEGIVLVNGVPEQLNHAGPAETAEPPLDDVTLFWGWLGGYRFIVAELLPVGDAATGAAAVHVGSTGCSGTQRTGFRCERLARNEIRLAGFDPASNVVVADLAEVFKHSDLTQPPQCHGVAPACAAPYAALGVNMETGEPAASQQVFRVE